VQGKGENGPEAIFPCKRLKGEKLCIEQITKGQFCYTLNKLMRVKRLIFGSVLVLTLLAGGFVALPLFAHSDHAQREGQEMFKCNKDDDLCVVEKFAGVATKLADAPTPLFTKPTPPPAEPRQTTRTVTYRVITRGNVTASLSEFKSQANQTLNDRRGWSRLGLSFREVSSGGDFILAFSEASQVPTFSPGCDAEYSCRVGDYVIINEARWKTATPSWNNAVGSLRDYRHMVVNHEVGHWLGHGHYNCGGAGQKAPVMQQQSMDLQGCKFNAWPVDRELFSSRYGI
jgi:hypothetical protein